MAPHPFLAIILSPKGNIVILSLLVRSVQNMYILCHIRICSHSCKGNESKSTCSGCMGKPGWLPAPSPLLRWRSCRGGGEGWRAGSCLGMLSGASKSHELKWRVFPASKFSGLKSRINLASFHGGFYWQIFLAGYFSTFIWRVFMASKSSGF